MASPISVIRRDGQDAIGTEVLTFAPTVANFQTLTLDAGNMTVGSVTLGTGVAARFKYVEEAEKLAITMDRPYAAGEETQVTVAYHTNGPTEQSKVGFGGLVFIKPNPGDVLVGHPWYQPWTVFRRSSMQPGWKRIIGIMPYAVS